MKRALGVLVAFLLGVLVVGPLPAAGIGGDPGPGCAVDWTAAGQDTQLLNGRPIVGAGANPQERLDRSVIEMQGDPPGVFVVPHTKCAPGDAGIVPGVTVDGAGQHLYANVDRQNVNVRGQSPFGNLESARDVGGTIEVKGWALDPDTTAPIYVWVTLDGIGRHLNANQSRPDVSAAYPGSGPNHGFLGTLAAGPGTHRICVTAANVYVGSHTDLGCRSVTVAGTNSPFGNFEKVLNVNGGVQVWGWAIDPDTTNPIYVWVTVDGVGAYAKADMQRADVAAVHPAYGPGHGFALWLTAGPGTRRICVTASNVSAGSNTTLGCRSITLREEDSPFGNFESARVIGPNTVEVKGWVIDPNTPNWIPAYITVEGRGGYNIAASRPRPDVAAAYPDFGPNHGFLQAIRAPSGPAKVCAAATNVGPGAHRQLGCREVVIP